MSHRLAPIPKPVLSLIIVALVSLVLLKVLVLWLEPRMAFFPLTGVQETPRDLDIPFREIALPTIDGETIYAWLLPNAKASAEIVFWHGNGGNLSLWLGAIETIYRQGFTVLAMDYRGYGKSTGHPTEQGLYRDVDALVAHYTTSLHDPSKKTIFWGRSLGGALAAYATTQAKPDGLILESTFADKQSLLVDNPFMYFLGLLSRYQFPAAKFLEDFDGPVLVMHGDRDTIIPFRQGRKLFDRLRGDKQFATIPGADHNDMHRADEAHYWEPVLRFVDGIRPPVAQGRMDRHDFG